MLVFFVLFVFILCLVCPMLPVCMDCAFLIDTSIFSNVYLLVQYLPKFRLKRLDFCFQERRLKLKTGKTNDIRLECLYIIYFKF
jgi:hypothetical protein